MLGHSTEFLNFKTLVNIIDFLLLTCINNFFFDTRNELISAILYLYKLIEKKNILWRDRNLHIQKGKIISKQIQNMNLHVEKRKKYPSTVNIKYANPCVNK